MLTKKLLAVLKAQWLAELSPKVTAISGGESINDDITIYRRFLFVSNRSEHYADFITILESNDVAFSVEFVLPGKLTLVMVTILEPITKEYL